MRINNFYETFLDSFLKQGSSLFKGVKQGGDFAFIRHLAHEWELDLENVHRWMKSPQYRASQSIAKEFIKEVPKLVSAIEEIFQGPLKGELFLAPSLMRFDGFARYDSGAHKVVFGVDHPDASVPYLTVLLSHELSHVYRDHQPRIWEFLGKPLEQITRAEYLDHFTAEEHLVSEGLATLFSQATHPEVPLHLHLYYSEEEMGWCLQNESKIDAALLKTMATDKNVWDYYQPGVADPDSPARVQYFWAARKISEWLVDKPGKTFLDKVVWALALPYQEFDCF